MIAAVCPYSSSDPKSGWDYWKSRYNYRYGRRYQKAWHLFL